FNVLGVYFIVRFLVCDSDNSDRVIKLLSLVCAFVSVFMVIEQHIGRNLFSVFGGIPDITPVREGRLRSQGPFAHAIIAGTVGAIFFPLFVSLWWARRGKLFAVIGVISGLVMALTSASATPLMAITAAASTLCFWSFRSNLRYFRWALGILLVGLHLVMK